MELREWWCRVTLRHGKGLLLYTTYGIRCYKCWGFIKENKIMKYVLMNKEWSFTARHHFPAGTEVEITKHGKRTAINRVQVRTKEGQLLVVFISTIKEIQK